MDPQGLSLYKLYQGHMRFADGDRVKVWKLGLSVTFCVLIRRFSHPQDLSQLNRDLSKVILIDDNPQSFRLHKNNAVKVTWPKIFLLELLPTVSDITHRSSPSRRIPRTMSCSSCCRSCRASLSWTFLTSRKLLPATARMRYKGVSKNGTSLVDHDLVTIPRPHFLTGHP